VRKTAQEYQEVFGRGHAGSGWNAARPVACLTGSSLRDLDAACCFESNAVDLIASLAELAQGARWLKRSITGRCC